jgi:hypothetical protein
MLKNPPLPKSSALVTTVIGEAAQEGNAICSATVGASLCDFRPPTGAIPALPSTDAAGE